MQEPGVVLAPIMGEKCKDGCIHGLVMRICNECYSCMTRKRTTGHGSADDAGDTFAGMHMPQGAAAVPQSRVGDMSDEDARLPILALANGNFLGTIPACYEDASPAEKIAVCPAHANIKVMVLAKNQRHHGNGSVIKGNTFVFKCCSKE